MSAENRYDRSRELFEQALDLPAGERHAFLEGECGDDQQLFREVASLIEAEAGAGSFLETPVSGEEQARDSWIGRSIGQYRIIEVIAGGGMGVVYRAQQDHPRRQVALKLIRSGAVSQQMLKRFELESEVLGRLHHPGIAQVYEASTTSPIQVHSHIS